MTELEQILLSSLKALDAEHSTANQRIDAMSLHIEQQQKQIDQLAESLRLVGGSVKELSGSVDELLNLPRR